MNVVGQLRMTQLCLPALRAARGRVVNMGSISGLNALPLLGAYAMSKFALEAMTDSLRVELAPWGIHVAIVEPGTIKTPIWTRERPDPPAEALSLYGARIDAFRRLAVKRGTAGAPPEAVADAVEHALTAEKPRTRYLVGRDAKLRARVRAAARPAARPRDRPPRPRRIASPLWTRAPPDKRCLTPTDGSDDAHRPRAISGLRRQASGLISVPRYGSIVVA